ncbi:hypothetical protein [Sphingomonas koreensis]
MHFAQLLKSLDELLYEIMSWLIFYPVTLWRALTRPVQMMDYSDHELGQAEAEQYTDTLRPPLFLLVSLLLAHALELLVVGDSPLIASHQRLAALVDDDTSLLLMRLVVFSVFPLVFATQMVRAQRRELTRDTLRHPFYAQCYAAAPFALMMSVTGILIQIDWLEIQFAGLVLGAITLLAFGSVQARWFALRLDRSLAIGFGHASIAMIGSLALVLVSAPLFA